MTAFFGSFMASCAIIISVLVITEYLSSVCLLLQLLQMIHFITMALGGEGYLNFMGNEVWFFSVFNSLLIIM